MPEMTDALPFLWTRTALLFNAGLDTEHTEYVYSVSSKGHDATGAGDMTKAVYDTDNDGKVDIAEVADDANHADAADDASALDGHPASYFAPAAAISNPNLLFNPWFTVNQRGATSKSSSGYFVDRWIISSGISASLDSDSCVTLSATNPSSNPWMFYQREESYPEIGTYTASIDIRAITGKVRLACSAFGKSSPWFDSTGIKTFTFTATTRDTSKPLLVIEGNAESDISVKVAAVKVEKGSISTLAMDTKPNYQTELVKCMRFYQCSSITTMTSAFGVGYAYNATTVRVWCPLVVPMRASPTVNIIKGTLTGTNILFGNGTRLSATSMSVAGFSKNKSTICLEFVVASAALNELYVLSAPSSNFDVEFDAEL